jgi:hypothetical protein
VNERIDELIRELADAIRQDRQSEEMDDHLRAAVSAPSNETTKRLAERLRSANEEGDSNDA